MCAIPPLLVARSQTLSNAARGYTRRTPPSSGAAGSFAITSPSAVNPVTTMMCPPVEYPAPGSS
ncbi:hypothetical protein GCM10027612_55900 [Microbispora bryophytorum subsp. camponoti]